MKLILPYPDSRLLPNRKTDRWTKAEVTAQGRIDAKRITLDWNNTDMNCYLVPNPPVRMAITWYPKDNRMGDYDSMHVACKPFIDGIVDAGILPDDSPKIIKGVTLAFGKPDKKNPRTEIEIVEQVIERLEG